MTTLKCSGLLLLLPFFDDVIFTVMKQSILARSEMMANCTIRDIIYLFILVHHYIKGLSKLFPFEMKLLPLNLTFLKITSQNKNFITTSAEYS